MPDLDRDRASLRVVSEHPVVARQVEQHAVGARDRREAVAGADALHPSAGGGGLLHDRHQLVLGGRPADRGGSAGLVPGPVGPGRPALHAHDRNLVVGLPPLGDGVLAPWPSAAAMRMGCADDPDLGVGSPRAHPAPSRARWRSCCSSASAARSSSRPRPAPAAARSAFDRFLEASNTADVQLQYVDAEAARTRSTTRSSRRCEPIPRWTGRAAVHHRRRSPRRRDYDLGVFAGPDPALFTEIDEPRLLEGRRPDPSDPHEVLINRFTQRILGVEVGDTVTVGTFGAEQFGRTRTSSRPPPGPTIPLEVVGHRGDRVRPRRPGVQRLLRHAGLPRGVLGRGGRVRTHPRDRRRPGSRPRAGRRRASSRTSASRRCSSASSSDQAEKVEDGTRVLAVGLAAFAVGGRARRARRRRPGPAPSDGRDGRRRPGAARAGAQPRRVHHRGGPLVAAGHRGRRRAGRRARDRGLAR